VQQLLSAIFDFLLLMSCILRQFGMVSCWSIAGTRRLVSEAEADPDGGKESVAALFWFTLKGHSSGLHSRAESLLRLLLDHSILSGVTKNKPGKTPAKSGHFLKRMCHKGLQSFLGVAICRMLLSGYMTLNDPHHSHGLQR
jgi:hypothetical protein